MDDFISAANVNMFFLISAYPIYRNLQAMLCPRRTKRFCRVGDKGLAVGGGRCEVAKQLGGDFRACFGECLVFDTDLYSFYVLRICLAGCFQVTSNREP